MDLSPENLSRVRDSFDSQAMMQTFGAKLSSTERGKIQISAPILKLATQQHGYGHAALCFAIGDSAAGYAALTTMPPDQEVLTAEMKINLLSPAQGEMLVATGRVLKAGKRLVVVSAEVDAMTGGEKKLVAVLQGTMIPVQI